MNVRGKIFATLYSWHRWLGLFLAIHLVLLITTGAILVFKDEWSAEPKSATEQPTEKTPATLAQLVAKAEALYPKDKVLALSFDESDFDFVTVRVGLEGSKNLKGSHRLLYDRRTGEQLEKKAASGFWDFVLRLHREFLLGFYGKLYVGLIGFLFFLALLSGFVIYGPTSRRSNFGWIRRGRASWSFSDVHKFIGSASFAWLSLMAVTGLLLALSGQLLKVYQYTELNDLRRVYSGNEAALNPVSLDVAETAVRAVKPESQVTFITFPGSEFATKAHFIFVVSGKTSWTQYLSELVLVDAATGAVSGERSLPWYLKAAVLSEPLHFGNYGGLGLKTVWFIFGIAGLVLSLSGPALYFTKKRKTTIRPTRIFANPKRTQSHAYRTPIICLILITLGGAGAVFVEGPWDMALSLLVGLPLVILTLQFLKAYLPKKT